MKVSLKMIKSAKKAKQSFIENHPKVEPFLEEVKEKGFEEGQEIAIAVRYPDGTEMKTGIRLSQSDLELLNMLRSME